MSARIAQAAWLACRFPPRVTRGISSSRDFGRTRARRRKPKDAERAVRTGFFQRKLALEQGVVAQLACDLTNARASEPSNHRVKQFKENRIP